MRIVHIAPLMDGINTYGGPGTIANDLFCADPNLDSILLSSWWRKTGPWRASRVGHLQFKGSSLNRKPSGSFSVSMLMGMLTSIHSGKLVVIHCALDPLSVAAMIICIVLRRPFRVLTHGTLEARLVAPSYADRMVGRLLRRAKVVFTLTELETSRMAKLAGSAINARMLRNGSRSIQTGSPKYSAAFVGRLHPRKGFKLAMDAVEPLLKADSSFSFVVVGVDEGEGHLAAALVAKYPDQVAYSGGVAPHVANLTISQSRVLLAPAVNEPFGLTVTEAFAAKVPVLMVRDGYSLEQEWARIGAVMLVDRNAVSVRRGLQALLTESSEAQTGAAFDWWETFASFDRFASVVLSQKGR